MLESNLLEHDHMIKSCIQLTSADVDRAVELMNSYRGTLKHSLCTEIIYKFPNQIRRLIYRIDIHEIYAEKTSHCCRNHETTKTIRW